MIMPLPSKVTSLKKTQLPGCLFRVRWSEFPVRPKLKNVAAMGGDPGGSVMIKFELGPASMLISVLADYNDSKIY